VPDPRLFGAFAPFNAQENDLENNPAPVREKFQKVENNQARRVQEGAVKRMRRKKEKGKKLIIPSCTGEKRLPTKYLLVLGNRCRLLN